MLVGKKYGKAGGGKNKLEKRSQLLGYLVTGESYTSYYRKGMRNLSGHRSYVQGNEGKRKVGVGNQSPGELDAEN